MKYFRLNPNVESKKWKGYEVIADELFSENKERISTIALSRIDKKINDHILYYQILTEGKLPPINTVGSRFISLNTDIFREEKEISFDNGIQLLPLVNINNNYTQYLLLHLYSHIDCVDWQLSEYELWPKDYIVKKWQNPRGRFFHSPVLIRNKIPKELHAFRLFEWGGPFNIIISESFKNRIKSFNFDHSFLEFHPLEIV